LFCPSWVAFAHGSIIYRGLYNSLAWTPTFYAEQYGIGVRDSAWLSVLPSVAGAVGGIFAGKCADILLRQQQEANDGVLDDLTLTNVRKLFQAIALYGPAVALAALSWSIPEDPVVAQSFLMAAVGFQAFTAAGFEAGNQEKAGAKYAGLLYSVTSLPAVIFGVAGVQTVGLVLDATDQNWSLVFAMNAIVNVFGATAFVALYDSKREFE
jgi:MFS family permease